MADRPVKRLRRLSTENDDSESADDWMLEPAKNRNLDDGRPSPLMSTNSNTRARRIANAASPTASIERSSNEPPTEATRSIHLKVKAPPSKLREVTSGVAVNSRDSLDSAEVVSGPRKSRSKKAIVDESSEEDEEDEMAEGDDDDDELDDDAEGDDDDDDEDAEGDVDMEDIYEKPVHPPAPSQPTASRPKVTIRRAQTGSAAKAVGDKDLEGEDDDDELSEMESQDEEQVDELGEDEEGVEDEEGDEDDAEGDDIDSDDETPMGSRGATPDLSKLTRRQRAAYEEMDGGLMALSNEAQKKKHLTAEEHAMRRAEMARRRKNLSEKRNEEEKMDTINRLLKKQTPKRRGRVKDINNMSALAGAAEDGATPGEDLADLEKPPALYARIVSSVSGTCVGVPEEWLGTSVGRVFEGARKAAEVSLPIGKMVEEVQ
ncbi:MAG: hypothetical protein M1822_005497 [Bathelium mastoideum]|nr:MAG: hypothetical protein M1822_005497 [Bathelium mastoideum]